MACFHGPFHFPWYFFRAIGGKEKRERGREKKGKFSFILYKLSFSLSERSSRPAWPISSGFSRKLEYFARGLEISDPRNSLTDTSSPQCNFRVFLLLSRNERERERREIVRHATLREIYIRVSLKNSRARRADLRRSRSFFSALQIEKSSSLERGNSRINPPKFCRYTFATVSATFVGRNDTASTVLSLDFISQFQFRLHSSYFTWRGEPYFGTEIPQQCLKI